MQLNSQLRLCQTCLWCCRTGLRRLSQSAVYRASANYYDVLGVKPSASIDEIKNAFFDKSKTMHPDSDPTNPGLHTQFVELNEAYRVLSKELSRKEYDLRLRYQNQPYHSGTSQPFGSTTYQRPEPPRESVRYWEQFHHSKPREFTAEEQEKLRKRNLKVMGYCLVAIVVSIGAHWVFFRKLEEIHTNFMDEKDKQILQIYNDSKERARVNGYEKQKEILRQKHAEFQQKYKLRHDAEEK